MATARGIFEDQHFLISGRYCYRVTVVFPLPETRIEVEFDFEGDGGMMTVNPYECMFYHTFGQLFDV